MYITLSKRKLTEPMLAAKQKKLTDYEFLNTILKHKPLYAQPKIDGIRCLIVNGRAVSRKFLAIPNNHVRYILEAMGLPSGIDGELVTYTDSKLDEIYTISSKIMSEDGKPDFKYLIFDYAATDYLDHSFDFRYNGMFPHDIVKANSQYLQTFHDNTQIVQHDSNVDTLLRVEQFFVEQQRWEGVMFRDVQSRYKCGRATLNGGELIALKRFKDGEAIVLGMEELMHNESGYDKDKFGRTKRSKLVDAKSASGLMGKLLVKDAVSGIEFSIGTGFTTEMRKDIFNNFNTKYVGCMLTYKYQAYGIKNLPRSPVFINWRKDL
jgi:DNA ligase 1